MRSESMSKFLAGAGASLGVKIATGVAIAAAASAVAAQVVISRSANPAGWGRQVHNTVTFAPATGPAAASAPQPAGSLASQSDSGVAAGTENAQASLNPNDKVQDKPTSWRQTTTWFTEPNDPPIVAVQTKFVPKP